MAAITVVAYRKLVLHAAKYPTRSVSGVLLGTERKVGGDGGGDGAGGGGETLVVVDVVDAVPLLHTQTHLAPVIETALALVEEHCKAVKLNIVGWYYAEGLTSDATDAAGARRIATTIQSRFANAVLLEVVNAAVFAQDQMAVSVLLGPSATYSQQTGSWSATKSGPGLMLVGGAATIKAVNQSIAARRYERLVDFDESLDRVDLDWRNSNAALLE